MVTDQGAHLAAVGEEAEICCAGGSRGRLRRHSRSEIGPPPVDSNARLWTLTRRVRLRKGARGGKSGPEKEPPPMFTSMKEGRAEDWAHIAAEHGRHQQSAAAGQIMESLKRL